MVESKYKNLSLSLIENPTRENLTRLYKFFDENINLNINITDEIKNYLKHNPNCLIVGNHQFSTSSLWIKNNNQPLYTGFPLWQWMLQKAIPNSKTIAKTTGYSEIEKIVGYLELPSSRGTKFISDSLQSNCLFLFPEGGAKFLAEEVGGDFIHSARANNQTHIILMAMTDMPTFKARVDLFDLLDITKQGWETEEESVVRIKQEFKHKIAIHKIRNKF